jgi:hypothetical protein
VTPELARVAAWLLLGMLGPAVLLPAARRPVRGLLGGAVAAGGSVTLSLLPAIVLPLLAAAAAFAVADPPSRDAGDNGLTGHRRATVAVLVGGVAAVLATGPEGAYDALRHATADDRAWTVVGIGAAATVLSGPVVAVLLGPLAARLPDRDVRHVEAGRVIGMLERALVFGLLVVGA